MGNKIKYWGRVGDEKKFEILSKSHILINPSTREGWGLVNIEANSVGVPVVSYNSAGLIDSVKNNVSGIIVKNSTPEVIAEEVIKLLGDKKRYKKLVEGARKWSDRFSWKKSRKLSLALINKISLH